MQNGPLATLAVHILKINTNGWNLTFAQCAILSKLFHFVRQFKNSCRLFAEATFTVFDGIQHARICLINLVTMPTSTSTQNSNQLYSWISRVYRATNSCRLLAKPLESQRLCRQTWWVHINDCSHNIHFTIQCNLLK